MTSADPDLVVISSNLRRLRTAGGKTQEELADAVGLSRAGYRNIEGGASRPKEETLLAIARALGVPMRELLSPPAHLEHVRFRSLKRLKRREDVLHEVARWLRDYNELEHLLGEHVPNALKELERKVLDVRAQGIPAVAELVRKEFGLEPKATVYDICGLLEARGVKLHSICWETDAFFGLSVAEKDGGPAVIVNIWDRIPVETWIFSAAHELGHLLLHIGSYRVDEDLEVATQETEADEFASHFLLPESRFLKEWHDTRGDAVFDRVLKVKRIFRVSWRTVLYRLGQSLEAAERNELWRYFNGEYKRRTGQSLTKHDEPDGIMESSFQRSRGAEPAKLDDHDFRGDRLPALVRRGVEAEAISLGRAAEILNIDRKEMREIAAGWID